MNEARANQPMQPISVALDSAWDLLTQCESKASLLYDRIRGSQPAVPANKTDESAPYALHDKSNQLARRLDRLCGQLQNSLDHI